MPKSNPNPTGKNGKPISLAPYSFEDVVRKALSTKPPEKESKKATTKKKKTTKRKR